MHPPNIYASEREQKTEQLYVYSCVGGTIFGDMSNHLEFEKVLNWNEDLKSNIKSYPSIDSALKLNIWSCYRP